jgi:tetratricopeptide (TPR) repeat protein
MFDYDWNMAEMHFRKAIVSEPVPSAVRFRYATYYLLPLGRISDAMEQSRLALETDPLSMNLHFAMAWTMRKAKQYRETIEYAGRALEIDANFYQLWITIGLAHLGAGSMQEAITSLKHGVGLEPWWHIGVGSLAAAYYLAGDYEHNQEWARKLTGSLTNTVGAAFYYAAAGEANALFKALDGAHELRDVNILQIQHEPFFDPYRSDPRFRSLLQRMNLT